MAYTDGSNHPQLAVATQGLVKAYGGFKAVDGLNLRVPAGEVYGLLGPNGAGKSTTMKLLLGLTKPTSGSMWLLGQQVGKKTMIQPGRVGSMIEGPSFYPGLSGLDNCRMVADYLGLPVSAASAVLTKVGLQAYEKRKASAYSLGMKQRLGIAMALISQPELLLLDEAVVEMRQMIIDLAASQGITVIISSHILSEIEKMAPVVGIIADGHLLYQGTLENLRDKGHIDLRVSDPELASEILETQGIHHEYIRKSATLRIPEISDPQIGTLVTRLISHGLQVYRVASERKSLEEAFLELVENPQNHVAQGPVKPFGHKQRSIR